MAQKVIVTMLDDIDGTEATETVTFALDGKGYEIDLNEKNAKKLRDSLTKYADAGRRTNVQGATKVRRSPGVTDKDRLVKVREWARENGHQVSDRGRISNSVFEAYDAAH